MLIKEENVQRQFEYWGIKSMTSMMALQESNSLIEHHCRDRGLFFDSSKSPEVHLQYHKENLLTKWANQAHAAIDSSRTDSKNNNVKSRREFQDLVAAPADSTDMKPLLPTGQGRPNSNSSYPPISSFFTYPHTPASYSKTPNPYQNNLHGFFPSNNPGPSPSSTSFGYSNGTSDSYQLPESNYSVNLCSPRSQSPVDPAHQFFPDNPQEPYIVHTNPDFPAVPAVHRPNSPSSSSTFRFNAFNKNCFPLDKNGVSSSSPNSFHPQWPFQCEKCGFICDFQSALAEHIKTAHAPSPMAPYHGSTAFLGTDSYLRPIEPKAEVIPDSPDILDLDSQQKVFRWPDEDSAQVLPTSNPHSVSAMFTSWSNNLKSQYPQSQPYLVFCSNNAQNYPSQNGSAPLASFQSRDFSSESYTQQSNVPNQSINYTKIPNSASPKLTNASNSLPDSGISATKGDSWKSNEARRLKTYYCSACNKWFTSKGHLKRHYNTTLHKNTVEQSGQPDPATLPISSHHHPNGNPDCIHSSKTPPEIPNPPPNLTAITKAKKAKSISPQGDANTPSPALNNDNPYDRNVTFDRLVQHGFGNQGFNMLQACQTSAFDQRAPPQPQPFDGRPGHFDNRPQHGYTLQDFNPPASNPDLTSSQSYEYYRYDKPPLHNQQNSTNVLSAQSPNFQGGPSVYPSGGLPICPPFHPSLHTPNHINTFMGENILIVPPSDLPYHPQDNHTTHPYISRSITTGNDPYQNASLPSFSNFQQNYPGDFPFDKGPDANDNPFDKPVFDYLHSPPKAPDRDHNPDSHFHPYTSFSPYCNNKHLQLLNIHINTDIETLSDNSHSPMPPSPVEFPTSTNLDLLDPPKPLRQRMSKRKPDDSSNMVSSTGSPQPAAKKPVIKCEECDKYFNRICYLTQHNQSFHSGEKPFKCDRCGKRFHSEIRAKDHSRKHGGEKPYKCDMCPKSFNHKTDLRRHLCHHSAEKPYACDHCGKGFIRKDHMLKHVDTHKNGKRKFNTKIIDDLKPSPD